jgi:hypothetical protein
MHGFEVHLIAYLERQDRALIKGYLQNIRNHRFHGTIVDFVAATRRMRYFEYHTILTKINETCRMAKLSIRTFDREFLKENDILSDFIDTVNSAIPASDFVKPAGTVNASLRLEEIEIVRALNVLDRHDLIALFTENESELSFAERNRLRNYYYREEIRQIILNHMAPSNGALLADFLPGATEGLRKYWQTIPETGPDEKLDSNALANCLISLLRAPPHESEKS